MDVIFYDVITPPDPGSARQVRLEEVLIGSDYISLHVPKLPATTNLLNAGAFAKMKDGVYLVNCARGGVVDEDALYDALAGGKVAGAALDVFATEPPGASALVAHERVICTPHLGASTKEAQTNVAVAVAGQFIQFLKYGSILNAVNAPSTARHRLASGK